MTAVCIWADVRPTLLPSEQLSLFCIPPSTHPPSLGCGCLSSFLLLSWLEFMYQPRESWSGACQPPKASRSQISTLAQAKLSPDGPRGSNSPIHAAWLGLDAFWHRGEERVEGGKDLGRCRCSEEEILLRGEWLWERTTYKEIESQVGWPNMSEITEQGRGEGDS